MSTAVAFPELGSDTPIFGAFRNCPSEYRRDMAAGISPGTKARGTRSKSVTKQETTRSRPRPIENQGGRLRGMEGREVALRFSRPLRGAVD